MAPVYLSKPDALQALFGRPRGVVIGVIHLPALPGSPEYRGERAVTLLPLLAGSGVTEANVGELLAVAGDVIVAIACSMVRPRSSRTVA